MAVSKKAKAGVVILVLAALGLAGASAAAADDDGDDDDDPDVGPPAPDPEIPDLPEDPDPPVEPPPPAPDPQKKNYVGSGYVWPHQEVFPPQGAGFSGANCCRIFGLELEKLGYPTNAAAADWNVISAKFMSVVREFQRDYNVARQAQTVDPVPKALATDGLIGTNTIDGIINAKRWVLSLALTWEDIVGLA